MKKQAEDLNRHFPKDILLDCQHGYKKHSQSLIRQIEIKMRYLIPMKLTIIPKKRNATENVEMVREIVHWVMCMFCTRLTQIPFLAPLSLLGVIKSQE